MSTVDYDALDPGIRETVRRLQAAGFRTTDSGDGVSKPADERAHDFPHVYMVCDPSVMIDEARRLHRLIAESGITGSGVTMQSTLQCEQGAGPSVQAMFCPEDNIGVLMLCGVSDGAWP